MPLVLHGVSSLLVHTVAMKKKKMSKMWKEIPHMSYITNLLFFHTFFAAIYIIKGNLEIGRENEQYPNNIMGIDHSNPYIHSMYYCTIFIA